MIIGRKIKQLRELRNYSQLYVSERLGLSQSAYSKLENSDDIPYKKLVEIAKILDVNPEDILMFSEKVIFNMLNKRASGIVLNGMPEEERKVYRDFITSLQEEIEFLKSLLNKYTP